ncbi:MAG: hypothetical protein Q4F11_07895 [Eubacteriales bacterium]|nr:hypothetical protein [Eubacteriales bacterium]
MKKLREYFCYNAIKDQINSYGYVYSMKRYILSVMFLFMLVIMGSILFRLRIYCIIVIMIVGILCLPSVIRAQYYVRFQQRRFMDVDVYIHQMAYSFQKTPKISMALEDTYKISDGRLHEIVGRAIDELKYGVSQWVYRDALSIIEEEYGCERIMALHGLMVNVECSGGIYKNYVDVLLSDIDRWVRRVYQSQEEIRKVKRDITIGIVISVLLASTSVFIGWVLKNTSAMSIDISKEMLYQLTSAGFLILSMVFYCYTQIHYKSDWLTFTRTDKQIEYDLKIYMGRRKRGVLYKSAAKRIKEDLYGGFSQWLRNVALGLQRRTLQTAIKDSYDSCPCVMKHSLEEFIGALEADPSDVTPYYDFLREFKVPDISASVRTLYGLSEMDCSNIDGAINTLIARNYELQDKYQSLKQTDRLSLMKFSEYIPVFMVSVKMGFDMMLLLTCYL